MKHRLYHFLQAPANYNSPVVSPVFDPVVSLEKKQQQLAYLLGILCGQTLNHKPVPRQFTFTKPYIFSANVCILASDFFMSTYHGS